MESQRCITKGARATTTSWCVFVCTCVCVFMCACVCVRIVFQGALLIYKGWHDYYIMVCVCVHVRVCMCMCAYRISRCSLSIRGVARPTSLYFTYIGLARTIYIYSVYVFFGREITKFTVIYGIHTLWPHLFIIRVGQNRIYTPYMAVYSIKSLQKLLYIHRIYMALANPIYNIISYGPTRPLKDGALPLMTFYSCCVKAGYGATIKVHTQLYTHTHTHNNTHSLTHLHTRRSWTCWALACGTCGTSRGKPCHRKWCLASPWRRCPF